MSCENEDNDVVNTTKIVGTFRKLNDGPASGTAIAYEFNLGYIDAPNDSSYEIGASGTYYLSEQLGITATVNHEDVGEFDDTEFEFKAQYFISEQLFLNAAYSNSSDSTDRETTNTIVGVGGRF